MKHNIMIYADLEVWEKFKEVCDLMEVKASNVLQSFMVNVINGNKAELDSLSKLKTKIKEKNETS